MRTRAIAVLLAVASIQAQTSLRSDSVSVRAHLDFGTAKRTPLPAVLWLEPVNRTPVVTFAPHGHYTLLQKNRMFYPHLQVVPVGAVVDFPNADPFFHNVFSLFDGRRFDLGLYEAGSSKSVTFPREGVSYIFCNIHPEMSAVILSLTTPLFSIADQADSFVISGVPAGDYRVHLWTEGLPRRESDETARVIHMSNHPVDIGALSVSVSSAKPAEHMNKYGVPYSPETHTPY